LGKIQHQRFVARLLIVAVGPVQGNNLV